MGKARASNVYQDSAAFGPEMAFDGDPQTRWATDGGTQGAWLQVDLDRPNLVGRLKVLEAYPGRVQRFELQYLAGDDWKTALTGTTLGEQYEASFPPVEAKRWRLNIMESTEGPTLWEVELGEDARQ